MKLEGKVAFITGASRGIGGAIARAFARKGARTKAPRLHFPLPHDTLPPSTNRASADDGAGASSAVSFISGRRTSAYS